LAQRARITPAEVAREPLLVFCQQDYPEYWQMVLAWLRGHRLRPRVAGEYDGVDSLMAGVASGLGVALVTTRTAERVPNRVKLLALSSAPRPLNIAAGYRASRAPNQPLAVFIEELRKAASTVHEIHSAARDST
jgi:DNA-binding transcriptional LysR family regulator